MGQRRRASARVAYVPFTSHAHAPSSRISSSHFHPLMQNGASSSSVLPSVHPFIVPTPHVPSPFPHPLPRGPLSPTLDHRTLALMPDSRSHHRLLALALHHLHHPWPLLHLSLHPNALLVLSTVWTLPFNRNLVPGGLLVLSCNLVPLVLSLLPQSHLLLNVALDAM